MVKVKEKALKTQGRVEMQFKPSVNLSFFSSEDCHLKLKL